MKILIAETIRANRKAAGLTQEQLAEAMGKNRNPACKKHLV